MDPQKADFCACCAKECPEMCKAPEPKEVSEPKAVANNREDIQGDDYCTSGQAVYHCPPDPKHKHWSPEQGNCKWPKPCPATCFDHPTRRDWVDNHREIKTPRVKKRTQADPEFRR